MSSDVTHERRHAPATLPPSRDGGGRRLPAATQERAARSLGHDFGAVRVHAGAEGAGRADALGARAAAIGGDVYFAHGEYRPGTAEGDRLIGHELAHVVQQGGGNPARSGPADPERAAHAAGGAVAAGRTAAFGQPAAPARVPALQPKPDKDAGATQPASAPATQPAKSWGDRVGDAQKESDLTKKSAAMTTLVQEALGSSYTVKAAGASSPDKLDEKDYAVQPTINVDVRLNAKKKKNGNAVGDVVGHTFGPVKDVAKRISILGPKALKPGSPNDVALYADHELYHARKPLAGELEAWTDSFVNHFVKTFGGQWVPLITYYESETADKDGKYPRRTATITALDGYYRGLSDVVASGEKVSDKAKFVLWLRRRLSDQATTAFVKDLSAKTGITATPPTKSP